MMSACFFQKFDASDDPPFYPCYLAVSLTLSGYNMHTGRIYLETMSKNLQRFF
jgi:hypothetical protein